MLAEQLQSEREENAARLAKIETMVEQSNQSDRVQVELFDNVKSMLGKEVRANAASERTQCPHGAMCERAAVLLWCAD